MSTHFVGIVKSLPRWTSASIYIFDNVPWKSLITHKDLRCIELNADRITGIWIAAVKSAFPQPIPHADFLLNQPLFQAAPQ